MIKAFFIGMISYFVFDFFKHFIKGVKKAIKRHKYN